MLKNFWVDVSTWTKFSGVAWFVTIGWVLLLPSPHRVGLGLYLKPWSSIVVGSIGSCHTILKSITNHLWIHGCVGKGVFSLGMHSTYFIVNLLPTTQSCCLKSISILLKYIINSIWLKQIYYNTFSSFQKWTEDNGAIQEHFHYVLCVVEPPLKSPFRQFSVDLRPWNCNFSW